MSALKVTLPSVPSVNAMYLTTKFGKRIRTKKAKDWFEAAEAAITKAIAEQGWEKTEQEKVVVEVMTYWPDKRRRDTNNSAKALADALEHAGVYDDDRYALLRYIDYEYCKENPRVECVVYRFDAARDGWKHESEVDNH